MPDSIADKLWIASIFILLAAGCTRPLDSRAPPPSAPKEVVLRVWVENPTQPGAHAVAARSLATALRGCPDLELVDISGFEEGIVELRVDPARLAALQIDFSSVVSAVSDAIPERVRQRMRVDSKGCTIELALRMGHWDPDWKVEDVEALRRVVVQTQSGQTISLGIITMLRMRAGRAAATHMGQPALYLKIATGKARGCLDEIIEQYRQSHPGVRLDQVPSSD